MNEVTRIINAIEQGDPKATEKLLPLVYEELRILAAQKMSQEQPGQTLQATALVHDAYIRLLEGTNQNWNSRGHFFKAAAEAMRRILVENARRKKSLKRGGDKQRVELDESILIATQGQEVSADDLLALNDALDKLSEKDKIAADLIKLRIFGGLAMKEAVEMLGVSPSKAYADLEYALAWLRLEIAKSDTKLDS
ncbi:MAG: sigma-70 family RNA polymerase sigma factor [Planctomycetota bacterium]|jgi:RNA polymerase sigma factor (TIGR02999 family)